MKQVHHHHQVEVPAVGEEETTYASVLGGVEVRNGIKQQIKNSTKSGG
jgi:hypothetical protein